MNTSYDEIFESFLLNCGIDTSELPKDQNKIYSIINNAVNHYNNFMEEDYYITTNNETETIDKRLDGSCLLILAHCIKYTHLENQLIEFEEIWSPFQKEIGFKNYKDQIASREKTLERTKNKIIELISNIEDRNLMD
ncbi:TPA: hypothetical protein ACXDAY_002073 [Clostridium botulinum]|uniref:hypothetical protein n=1 Tax=Clostridium botulinum TaxID=1491 RepID=UPI000464AFF8|nr:hypothetical protein [Clostridium botulinum]APR02491.1 hypothetical protein RSJ2_4116 [Clostridium botulinum]AUN01623.1 hypothetical protein RSJ19_01200 [Clostridium botulinum]MBN3359344.1 hypothetical protein [Clostridium botulinum]MBN3367173.1 hypothetical protein [Clostridium botulinum]MBN3371806.1 hypothetical protein [Clostridium botulinum]